MAEIQDDTIGWQLQLMGHRIWQWVELMFSRAPDTSGPDFGSIEWPSWLRDLILWSLAGILILLVSWLIYLIVDDVLNRRQPRRVQETVVADEAAPPHHSATEWVRQANQLAQAGQWQAACRALYMAALEILDQRQWISRQSSRTDQEYLQQLDRLSDQLAQPRPYQLLIRTHERSHFGNEVLSEENFQRCRRAYQEVEKS